MKAIFLGLYHHIVKLDHIKEMQAKGVKVWTLNDFYMFYPFLMPDAIFQVHRPESLPIDTMGRWGADYRKIYNTCECPVYECWPDTGLDNELIMSDHLLSQHFPIWMYQCSVVYMLAMALDQGIEEVIFEGMSFVDDGERMYQVPYITRAVNEARKKGLKITVPPEIEAAWVDSSVSWRCIEDLQPYHAKEAPTSIKGLKIDLP
jgi:hypothetical protein